MSQIIAAVIQHSMTENKQHNLAKSIELASEAAQQGANLIVLPELHATPYFCQVEDTGFFDLAEDIHNGETVTQLSQAASDLGVVIVGSLFENRNNITYHNTSVVFDRDGSQAGIYRKMHIPDDPGFYEKFYFTPGDAQTNAGKQGFEPIQTSLGKLGVLVCWDQWYPEAARIMALKGADVLIYPTAIGYDPEDTIEEKTRQREAWITIQRSHAVANHLPVLVANRSGFEENPEHETGIEFWGHSFITGPQGELLTPCDDSAETVLLCELNAAKAKHTRQIWPFFRDRRIDAYGDLLKRVADDT